MARLMSNIIERNFSAILILLLSFYILTGGWILKDFLEWGEGLFTPIKIIAIIGFIVAFRVKTRQM